MDLAAIMTAVKRHVHFKAGLSSKSVPFLLSAMPKEEGVMDTVVPRALVKLNEDSNTAFPMLSNAIKAVCST